MQICVFYFQGRCRFGQNCRYEHTLNPDNKTIRNATSAQQLGNEIRQIAEEVITAEKGGQWPLSCFSPIKGGVNVAGWVDYSPEEIRWKMYQANATGTLNQCINEIKQLYKEAEQRRTFLKTPTMERVNLIVNVLEGKKEVPNSSNPFASTNKFNNNELKSGFTPGNAIEYGNSGSFTNNPTNIFASKTPTGSHGSIFGNSSQTPTNQGSILGGNSSSFPNQNIFSNSAQPNNTFSQNIFSNSQPSNQNIFSNSSPVGNNIFSNSLTQNQNIFSSGQAVMQGNSPNSNVNTFLSPSSGSIFSNQEANKPAFGSPNSVFQTPTNQNENQSNIFGGGQNENIFKNQNAFGNSGSVFSSQQNSGGVGFGNQNLGNLSTVNQAANHQAMDTSIFSKVEDLTEEELKSFAAATFVFGKIPLKPPPQDYCK